VGNIQVDIACKLPVWKAKKPTIRRRWAPVNSGLSAAYRDFSGFQDPDSGAQLQNDINRVPDGQNPSAVQMSFSSWWATWNCENFEQQYVHLREYWRQRLKTYDLHWHRVFILVLFYHVSEFVLQDQNLKIVSMSILVKYLQPIGPLQAGLRGSGLEDFSQKHFWSFPNMLDFQTWPERADSSHWNSACKVDQGYSTNHIKVRLRFDN
jgi:hypothetical protein